MSGESDDGALTAGEGVAGDASLAELAGENTAHLVESSLRSRVGIGLEGGHPNSIDGTDHDDPS